MNINPKIQTGSGTPEFYYLCKDHLGSITGVMNSSGNIVEEYNYDPWGRRRNPTNWSYSNVATPTYTQHGFTGHEHLDMFNLINMNGRIYDSEIARFLSPDPVIQDPYNILSYNRYSYCLNNPLKYTDPSGYSSRKFEFERMQYETERGTEFFFNYPIKWEIFQHQYTQHYTLEFQLGQGKPMIKISITWRPDYTWGRYDVEVRVYGKVYSEYNFMQTKSYEGKAPEMDRSWDYNSGFYNNDDDTKCYSEEHYRQGADGYFYDSPNGLFFNAELTVFGKRNYGWEEIQTFSWGYTIINGKVINDYFRLNQNPSSLHQDNINRVLKHWNHY